MSKLTTAIFLSLILWIGSVCAVWTAQAETISLSVLDAPTQTAFPVSSGIPFPKGEITGLDKLRLTDITGFEVPAQFSEIASWPDGSYKSILVDFLAQPGPMQYLLHYGSGITRQTYQTGLSWTENSTHIMISNGLLRFAVSKTAFTVFDQVWLDDNTNSIFEEHEKMLSRPGDIILEGNYRSDAPAHDYHTAFFTAEEGYVLRVEESGPLKITLLARGKHKGHIPNSDGDLTLTDFEIRMHFYAGSSVVRIFYTLIDTRERDMGKWPKIQQYPPRYARVLEVRDQSLVLPLRMDNTQYAFGGEDTIMEGDVTEEVYLLQDATITVDNKLTYDFDYSGVGMGEKAQGWFDISEETSRGIAGGIRWFWEQFPKELSYDSESREFKISLQPRRSNRIVPWEVEPNSLDNTFYTLYPGVAKTYELFLSFHTGDHTTAEVESLNQAFQKPPILFNSAWFTASGVFGPLIPVDGQQKEYDKQVSGAWDWRDRIGYSHGPGYRVFGSRDYGDYLLHVIKETPQYGNHHYEDPRGDLLQFLRSGERKWLEDAVAGARHHMDLDVMHVNSQYSGRNYKMQNNGPGQIHYSHAYFAHEQGDIHLGHVVPGGLTPYYLITGDRRALTVIREQGNWVYQFANRGFLDLSKGHLFEEQRSHGWPLHTIMESYLATGDSKYLDGASIIVLNSLWWWQNPGEHIINSPDPDQWPDLRETLDWTQGNSAWISNIKSDNCPAGSFTSLAWMAQFLIWGNLQWHTAIKEEMGLSAYSFDQTYLGDVTIPVQLVEEMMIQNSRFAIRYQWMDSDYTPRLPWFAGLDDRKFAYSPCRLYATSDGDIAMPYILETLSQLPQVTPTEKVQWQDIARKIHNRSTDKGRVPCDMFGYNGIRCMLTTPHFLAIHLKPDPLSSDSTPPASPRGLRVW